MPKYGVIKKLFYNNCLFLTVFSKKINKTGFKMSNPFFQFKQFMVWHDKCAMKVGTDGVLLGAWTSVQDAHRILDIGTGTGLVALMLAQRSLPDARIVALEINESATEQALENVTRSPWKDRISVLQKDFKLYQSLDKFDVIVSNPPYFIDSLGCPDQQRNAARHNDSLTYETLLQGVAKLLSKKGAFTIVIPADVAEQVKDIAVTYNLHAARQLNVITKPGGSPKRILIAFSFDKKDCFVEELLTELARHQYSEEYRILIRDYYLHAE